MLCNSCSLLSCFSSIERHKQNHAHNEHSFKHARSEISSNNAFFF
jgi:hypothetical protein